MSTLHPSQVLDGNGFLAAPTKLHSKMNQMKIIFYLFKCDFPSTCTGQKVHVPREKYTYPEKSTRTFGVVPSVLFTGYVYFGSRNSWNGSQEP